MTERAPLDAARQMSQPRGAAKVGLCPSPPRFPRAAATSGGVDVTGTEKLQREWRRGLKGKTCVGGGRANEADTGLEPRG